MADLATREQVLEALGIDNFRQLTSDKVIQFASLYHKMDPEVAKEAIKQVPEFAKTVSTALSNYKEVLIKDAEGDSEDTKLALQSRLNIIESLQRMLDRGDLTFEQETEVIKMMDFQADKIDAKDTEAKKARRDRAMAFGTVVLGVCAMMLAAIGGKGEFKLPQLPR